MAPKKKIATAEAPLDQASEQEERLQPASPQQDDSEENTEPEERLQAPVHADQVGEPEDYLRQYQYRKQTAFGSVASDPAPGSKAEKMKAELLRQRKVGMAIQLGMNEDPSVKASVNINGYRLDFPKNSYIEIPEQVANLIMESQGQTVAALQQFQGKVNDIALLK